MAKPWREVGRYGGVGLEFVLTILLVGALGQWLDRKYWGAHGWGLGIGFLLGVAVAFRNLIRTAGAMQADIERAEARDPEAGRWKVAEGWLHEEPGPEGIAEEPDSLHTAGPEGTESAHDDGEKPRK
jgi:Putative F0F1-ATPase subunit Ca2+/Mg2+ transporter